MIHGTTIENTVMGGPAYNSKQIDRGDVILKIDGKTATSDNVKDLLVGKDVPGSNVTIMIAKGSSQVNSNHCFFQNHFIRSNSGTNPRDLDPPDGHRSSGGPPPHV